MTIKANLPTRAQAKRFLKEGRLNRQPLTAAQRKLFGLIASGRRPTSLTNRGKLSHREHLSFWIIGVQTHGTTKMFYWDGRKWIKDYRNAQRFSSKTGAMRARDRAGSYFGHKPYVTEIRSNPPEGPGVLYDQIGGFWARKGQAHACDAECRRADHWYEHVFTVKYPVIGTKDGYLRI